MQANKAKLNQLIKTARGQLDGILKMIEEDAYCIDVSNQLMAADAILRRANREVLSAHLSGCVRQALESGETGQIEKSWKSWIRCWKSCRSKTERPPLEEDPEAGENPFCKGERNSPGGEGFMEGPGGGKLYFPKDSKIAQSGRQL